MKGMTLIVKTVTRLVAGFIVIFGINIVIYGHITPGGGFAGGVILAGAFILVLLAFGKDYVFRLMSDRAASVLESVGALAFLALALIGYLRGDFFLNILAKGDPFRLFSAGIIPLCNVSIGIKVGAALFAVVAGLSVFRARGEVAKK